MRHPATALLLLMSTGCGEAGSDRQASSRSLLVFCGAGLRPPVAELIERFSREHRIDIACDFAGSEVLLSKIRLGEAGDLYVPGDRSYVDAAEEQGLILERRQVCILEPTILVQKGNPGRISGLEDLLRPGVRLGLGDPRACAIGPLSRRIFEKRGVPWKEVERRAAFLSVTVNELAMQIQAGSLDAVIVWDAVAKLYEKHGDVVAIPLSENEVSRVEGGILRFTRNRQLARELLELLTSPPGLKVFDKHGYRVRATGGESEA